MTVQGSSKKWTLLPALREMCGCVDSAPSRAESTPVSRGSGRAAGLLRGEKGQALIVTALAFTGIMGGMALAVDVGYLHYEQRLLQTAAQSAAISAGLELGICNKAVCNTMTTAAQTAMVEDGIVTSSSNITTATPNSSSSASSCSAPSAPSTGVALLINVSPCLISTDPNNGNPNMAEVVLVKKVSTYFGKVLGIPTVTIVARAEAGDAYIKTAGGGYCIYTKSLAMNSNASFDLTNCGVYDGGNLQTDANTSGTATDFLYYGSWSPNNCHKNCTWTLGDGETQPTVTTTQQPDPLAGQFTTPTVPGNNLSNINCNSTCTLSPGHYTGDLNLNSNVTANLTPGLYYFDGSFNINSNSAVECTTCTNGAGVTLYFNTGHLQVNSNSTVNLTAPASGNKASGNAIPTLLLWQPSSNSTSVVIDSNGNDLFSGIVYLPSAQLTMNSNSTIAINGSTTSPSMPTMFDTNSLLLDSNQHLVINGSSNIPGASGGEKLGTFALAE
jgi:hypothetical protein